MSFLDITLPLDISLGSTVGLSFQTDVVVYGNGKTYKNSRSDYQRAKQDISYTIKSRDVAIEMYKFFITCKGRFHSFRAKDNLDYTSAANGAGTPTATDQIIGVGNGVKTSFQLTKTYTIGSNSSLRNITKPKAATVLAALGGVPTTFFTVNTTTGTINFNTPPSNGVQVSAGFEFDVEMRFDQDSIEGIEYIFLRQNKTKDMITFPPLSIIEEI